MVTTQQSLPISRCVPESGAVSVHKAIESSSESGSMATRRHQKGCVYSDGGKWKGRDREDVISKQGTTRVRREVILGSRREMTKYLAERRREVVLARINGFDYRPGRLATFEEFLECWKAQVLTKQQPSSARAAKPHLTCYIIPQLGKGPPRAIRG